MEVRVHKSAVYSGSEWTLYIHVVHVHCTLGLERDQWERTSLNTCSLLSRILHTSEWSEGREGQRKYCRNDGGRRGEGEREGGREGGRERDRREGEREGGISPQRNGSYSLVLMSLWSIFSTDDWDVSG